MSGRKMVDEETWSSFHRKYRSTDSIYSSKKDLSLWQSASCFSGSSTFDDDDDEKCWISALLDFLTLVTTEKKTTARKALADDDSFSSMDSSGRKRRGLLRKKVGSLRRQGNVKISDYAR